MPNRGSYLNPLSGSPAIPRVGTKLVPIGPQRLGLFGRLYRAHRNTKYGRLLLELMTRTLGCLILAGLQHPGPLRGPPTAGPTLAMTNLPPRPSDTFADRLCPPLSFTGPLQSERTSQLTR